jgi:hypothetical protein
MCPRYEGKPSPGDDLAEPFVVGVVVAPDDVPADHAALLLVAGVVGPVEREVAQGRELRLYAVQPGTIRRRVGDLGAALLLVCAQRVGEQRHRAKTLGAGL